MIYILGAAVTALFIWMAVHRGKVKAEQEVIHNRISALADEANRAIDRVKTDAIYIAKNAQGIASNALSSAQRAESKIAAVREDAAKAINNLTGKDETTNA